MPGLRGVGKTTIMAQTYFEVLAQLKRLNVPKEQTLFVSLDDAVENLDVSLKEIIEAYEVILGVSFEKQKWPTFLFIDEAQYDPKWGVVLKTLFDKSKRVFIFCTGSSALELRSNPDVARRSALERLYPMNFTEYEKIHHDITPVKGLKEEIKNAVYHSPSAPEAFNILNSLGSKVAHYWSHVEKLDVNYYLEVGTFPFALNYPDKNQVYEALNNLIDKIINTDVPRIGNLKIETVAMMRRLLYLLADANDTLAVSKLANLVGTNGTTLAGALDVLKDAECLIKIPPYGSATSSVKKPTKYCFMSPALRASLLSIAGSDGTMATRSGKYWEDIVALHLYREFASKRVGTLLSDPSQGAADFIFQMLSGQEMAIEVGSGQKGTAQVMQSMKERGIERGLVISSRELSLSQDERILLIPFSYFLLM
jgi:predicted AAA+ superfamily ATPase